MGFFDQGSSAKAYAVSILLAGFQARSTLQVHGLLQTFINDDQKGIFSLHDVTLYGLESGNPATSMSVPELFVRKDQCHALAFEQAFSHEETGLLPRVEPVAVYTSHYAIQGNLHMGSDALLGDAIESSKSMYIGITDAYLFPLFKEQVAMIQQAPLVFIHRDRVRMHHRM